MDSFSLSWYKPITSIHASRVNAWFDNHYYIMLLFLVFQAQKILRYWIVRKAICAILTANLIITEPLWASLPKRFIELGDDHAWLPREHPNFLSYSRLAGLLSTSAPYYYLSLLHRSYCYHISILIFVNTMSSFCLIPLQLITIDFFPCQHNSSPTYKLLTQISLSFFPK